ncbi:chondroitin sulfate glucuronyltransferase-like [Ciona intestinalis]
MVMRRLKFISNVRPFLPVIIGLSLGFSISIVRMPILNEDCVFVSEEHIDRKLNSIPGAKFHPENGLPNSDFKTMSKEEAEAYRKDREYAPAVYDSLEDFEPRIITDPELKPKVDVNLETNKKKIVRTRYISTELGIREKLVSAVITSSETYLSMAVAMNKTFSHHMQKVIFFNGESVANDKALTAPGMTLVTHPDDNPVRILSLTLKYLHLKFKSEYDWFFITTDSTYAQADRVNHIVDHISINRRLYLGKPMSYNDKLGVVNYCSMKSGFIISRLLLLDLAVQLDACTQDGSQASLSPDKWLGRCIKRATSGAVECVDEEEAIFYHTFNMENNNLNFEVETTPEFEEAVTVSGVNSPQMMFQLHKKYSQLEIDKAYKEIGEIQDEIKSLVPKLPEGERELSWPIGINPSFKPTNRWDIIVWDYFTEDYTLTCPGEVPKCDLTGVDKLDIQNILQIALDRLNEKYNPQGLILEKRKLINGYRRFDPQRGMEYILDLLLTVIIENENQEIELSHRVNMLRPLSQVEIIPMPYVTESAKVHIILPLTKQERVYFEAFMDKYAKVCLNNDENVALNIVFVYDPETAQRIHQDDIFAEQKQLLQTYEARYKKDGKEGKLIPWVSIKTEVPSQLKTMDIVAKKYPTESLFLLTSVAANMNTNFLNRCRMNAIPGWQVFFPIPFSQYNPQIIFQNGQVPEQIDIKPSNGHFDLYSFDEVCFYNSDYMASRTKMAATVSAEDSKESLSDLVDTLEVYDVMIKYSQLHVFRAVEPQLTRRYVHRNCNKKNGQEIFDRCERSNAEGLASRTQLAMELFPENKEPSKT